MVYLDTFVQILGKFLENFTSFQVPFVLSFSMGIIVIIMNLKGVWNLSYLKIPEEEFLSDFNYYGDTLLKVW